VALDDAFTAGQPDAGAGVLLAAVEARNTSKMRSMSSGSIPIPSSWTETTHSAPSRSAETCTRGGASPL
jgi:hypothetical protein